MQPLFLYFDIGKVLVDFSLDQMMAQAAEVAEVPVERVRQGMLNEELLHRYECGKVSTRDFYEALCAVIGRRPDYGRLANAFSEIFSLNLSVLPVVSQLEQAGYRLGVLSNTCELHWDYCFSHYGMLSDAFTTHVLSYCVGASKPAAAIYQAAVDAAAAKVPGCRPENVFFVDDLPVNVAGAKAFGLDAVQFTTASALAAELRARGVQFNY
jgi:glucose-1-phosphatase